MPKLTKYQARTAQKQLERMFPEAQEAIAVAIRRGQPLEWHLSITGHKI